MFGLELTDELALDSDEDLKKLDAEQIHLTMEDLRRYKKRL